MVSPATERILSLRAMFLQYVSTVLSEIKSCKAICLFDRPHTTQCRISRSRSQSDCFHLN